MQETTLIEQEQPVGGLTTSVPAPAPTMTLCSYGTKLTREELALARMPAMGGNAGGDSNPQTHSAYRSGGQADRSLIFHPDV